MNMHMHTYSTVASHGNINTYSKYAICYVYIKNMVYMVYTYIMVYI